MDKFVVKGPAKLTGSIRTDGSKNAALPIMAGALLVAKGETVIKNVPPLRDINTFIKVLEFLGARISYDPGKAVVTIDAGQLTGNTAPYELMRQMRASFLVLGPVLARLGEAKVSLPGGCSLGSRPVDFHIKAFAAMKAKIEEKSGYIIARGKPLHGDIIYFDRPSHTGTENLLYGAVFAKGKTTIINAACDPEVIDVANYLNEAGARIHGAGTPTITVEPVGKLNAIEYTVSGDRLVAGTYLIGAAMTSGDVEVSGIEPEQLTMVLRKLEEMGAKVNSTKKKIRVQGPKRLGPINLTTFPFPGFPTDLQACMMAAACTATGTSHIKETVFVDRFSHTMELRRLGADIQVASSEAVVNGIEGLQGAEVMAPDIRAGAGITLACLSAKGKSEILRVYHIDRGYHQLEEKLASLGADISRQPM